MLSITVGALLPLIGILFVWLAAKEGILITRLGELISALQEQADPKESMTGLIETALDEAKFNRMVYRTVAIGYAGFFVASVLVYTFQPNP